MTYVCHKPQKSDFLVVTHEKKYLWLIRKISFFSEVIHKVDSWEGNRMTLNFNFKYNILWKLDHYSITSIMVFQQLNLRLVYNYILNIKIYSVFPLNDFVPHQRCNRGTPEAI